MAETYDSEFTNTPVGMALRRNVWRVYDRCFGPGDRVLDLGCGTGADALHLAARGLRVVAVDPSATMIRVAAASAARAGLTDLISLSRGAAETLDRLALPGAFDGVVSGFGAVNCVVDYPALGRNLARLVRPGGRIVLVTMGPICPWEMARYLLRGRPGKAFRRLAREPSARVGGRTLQIRYPSPGRLARSLGPWFRPVGLRGVGLLLPPTPAPGWLHRRPWLAAALGRLEGRVCWRGFAYVADHYVLTLAVEPDRAAEPLPGRMV